jgi:hypothetical protein
MAELILAAKPPLEVFNDEGYTPLHLACQSGNIEIAGLLLNAKANPNAATSKGLFPVDLVRQASRAAAAQPMSTGKISPAQYEELVQLLLQHGADELLTRKSTISVMRAGRQYHEVVFRRGTNDFNRYTLYELFMMVYRNRDLPFPDLNKVTIHRLRPDDTSQEVTIDLEAAVGTQYAQPEYNVAPRTNDLWLAWGDRVEIPEKDHPLSANWPGLYPSWADRLAKALSRTVEFVANQRTNRFQLLVRTATANIAPITSNQDFGTTFTPDSFRLHDVVKRSRLFGDATNLTVRVSRTDPVSGRPLSLGFNLASQAQAPESDLWLRDGDRIEVMPP